MLYYLLEKLRHDKRGRRDISLCPTPCVFIPTIYFLNLKGKPRCAELERNGLKEAKGKRSGSQYLSPLFLKEMETCCVCMVVI